MKSLRKSQPAFVHSLVKTTIAGETGWCAPRELGEAAPHSVSFVIPVADDRTLFEGYACEIIVADGTETRVERYELARQGEDSFVLHYGESEIWFTVRPGQTRLLPYVGKFGHDDFQRRLVEIEPENPDALDTLYDDHHSFLIGCDPFRHYTIGREVAKSSSSVE